MSHKIRRLVRKSNRGEDGFTLIEVLVALAILSIIAVGIYSALGTSLASSVSENERANARNLAESQMEYVKQLKLDFLDYYPIYDPNHPEIFGANVEDFYLNPPLEYSPDEDIMSQYSGFEVTIYAVQADAVLRDQDLQRITVRVSLGGEEVWAMEGYKLLTYDTFIIPPIP